MTLREGFYLMAGVLTGGFLMGAVMIAVEAASADYDHDPAKLLELRRECLKDSPNVFTTYCDNYAERYSRTPSKVHP